MRGFIKFCGGLFVFAGIIVLVVGLLVSVVAAKMADDRGGLALTIGGLVTLFGAAGITLIGGVAYMLCSIDHRLQIIGQQSHSMQTAKDTLLIEPKQGA